ncbi:MAG: aconitase X catalytic domain-containing protein [Gemmatimonadota bacterium]|nr:MAG: aconitase X catalytic domain-containing protein [Gemmatimonadota bacterium]
MVRLTTEETAMANGAAGEAATMAMRIVVEMARLMGAEELIPISSAHIDGCLYHGDGGVEFAERLVAMNGRVSVPTTLNVGALDLLAPQRIRSSPHDTAMARRLMSAYVELGCRPTWTCAPYQVGHRPGLGEHVAWGESNAVAFANSVLGARTNRCGDFFDICCALTGRAPLAGLHLDVNRRATVVVDTKAISPRLKHTAVFYPVLGTWLGATCGSEVAVIDGLPTDLPEDWLKALGAAASSSGAVGLFHVAGVTPEAPNVRTALAGQAPLRNVLLTPQMVRATRDRLSTAGSGRIDAVAVGSPHFSLQEFAELERLSGARKFSVPFYVCTGRDVLEQLESTTGTAGLRERGVEIVVDTCVVVTPILASSGGVLMTCSGKFAHYTPANTGYEVVYGSLEDCVASAAAGRVIRDESLWS